MNKGNRLDSWPKLRRWYDERQQSPAKGSDEVELTLLVCRALSMPEPFGADGLCQALRTLTASSSNAHVLILAAEKLFAECESDFMAAIAELARDAVCAGRGHELALTLRLVADQTHLVGMRFLSAWTLLNTGQLSECIDECEKIDGAYASVCTLHGQALLESGQVDEAIRLLQIATQLGPREILAWFQLGKALLIHAQTAPAWDALQRCLALSPGNPEIGMMLVLVALEKDASKSMQEQAYQEMTSMLRHVTDGREEVQLYLLKLAARLGDQGRANALAKSVCGAHITDNPKRMGMVAEILRAYQELGWMETSTILLDGLLSPSANTH